jgi:RimJ/RimL family protein N-acetyltransferase
MWSSGDVVVLRYRSQDGRFRSGRPLRVVAETDDWLVTYLAENTEVAMPILADGRGLRDVPLDERWSHPRATDLRPWRSSNLVLLFPRGRAYSLWLFREHGAFRGWYVNLEQPHAFGTRTIDTRDNVLDVWVPAETRDPEWKDEDELEAAARYGRVTPAEAVAIRTEGERVIRERPWPTGWEEFSPPPDWTQPSLPPGWDAGPLEVGRLVLTPLDDRDLDDYAALEPHPPRELDVSSRSWREDGFGFWAVRDGAAGPLVAVVESHRIGPGVEGIAPEEVEVGWVVHPERRNEGIATAATRAVLADLRDRAGVDHVAAYIRPENEPSLRVAAKLGLRRRGDGRSRDGSPVGIYELVL